MRIELHKRPIQSKALAFASPLLALALTILAGLIMFSILGKDPFKSFNVSDHVRLDAITNVLRKIHDFSQFKICN